VRQLVERGVRIALLVAGAIVTVIVAIPSGLLTLVFQKESAELASQAMRILSVGMGFFALLGVATAALNGLGEEKKSLLLTAVATLGVATLGILFAWNQPLSPRLLSLVASATSLAMLGTAALAFFFLRRLAGAHVPYMTLGRMALAGAISASLTSQLIPKGALFTLLGSLLAAGLYVTFLILFRELNKNDWRDLTKILAR
jgi:stage V sporulation protein B